MKIFGHRGSSKLFPENTLQAFTNCVNINADGIELDIQITRDKYIIVRHDTFDKNTGIFTYEKDYDYNEHILLTTVFEAFGKNAQTYILDLKDTRSRSLLVPNTFDICVRYGLLENCIFSSFNEYHLRDVCVLRKWYGRKINCAYISANVEFDMFEEKISKWKLTHLILYKFQISKELISFVHSLGVQVYIFTSNTHGINDVCRRFDCDGIISDSPESFVN